VVFFNSVADPGCLSQIPDPDFCPYRIPDLGSRIQKQKQKRGVKIISGGSHKYHKIENYIISELVKKKIWANLQRILKSFIQKMTITSQKYRFGIWDPGSGKNLFRIPDPGVKKGTYTGSGSATLIFYYSYSMRQTQLQL
jgi:hypothetical protein